jgi:hypothetical protein
MEEEKKNQCKKTFTFHFNDLPMKPSMTFKCMREEHTADGKHEYIGISTNGGEYKVIWASPQKVAKGGQPVFVGKQSKTIQ